MPYKYRMLFWNICHSILPIADVLAFKVLGIDLVCVRCFSNVENHLRLLWDCASSSTPWSMNFQYHVIFFNLDLQHFFILSWHDFLSFNLSSSPQCNIIFDLVLWHLWFYRNIVVFKLSMSNIVSLYNKFWVDYKFTNILQLDLKGATSSTTPLIIIWAPPQPVYFKLITDDSYSGLNDAGSGGVTRNEKGE